MGGGITWGTKLGELLPLVADYVFTWLTKLGELLSLVADYVANMSLLDVAIPTIVFIATAGHMSVLKGCAASMRAEKEKASRLMTEGRRIYDAAEEGVVAALRPLVQQWRGREDVLNWANPDLSKNKDTPLIVGSQEGKLEAVKLLLAMPGMMQCCRSLD